MAIKMVEKPKIPSRPTASLGVGGDGQSFEDRNR